jgi:hypothetical protein
MSDPRSPVREVASLLVLWEQGRIARLGQDQPELKSALVRDTLLTHRHEIHRALNLIAPLPLPGVPRPLAAFCYLIFAREDQARANSFFVELAAELEHFRERPGTGEVTRKASATYRLARRMARDRYESRHKPGPAVVAALFFKAWLFYRVGLQTRQLKVLPGEAWWDLVPAGPARPADPADTEGAA